MSRDERLVLERRWLDLTRVVLPALAAEREWPISADHCFQRVLLDHACGQCWYAEISARPAYKAAADEILERAVQLGEGIATGSRDLTALNRQSLAWRGKLVTTARSR